MSSFLPFCKYRPVLYVGRRQLLNFVATSKECERLLGLNFQQAFPCSRDNFRRRKPIWMPTAKTKLYRIPKHPVVPEDEKNEHKRLYVDYKTKMNSLQAYFVNEYRASDTLGELALELAKEEEVQLKKLLELNDAENARVASIREDRCRRELEREEEESLQKAFDMEEWRKNKQREIEELVRVEKEKSKNYITADKLDAAIEEALDNPVNYNFAIDLDGNILWETAPHPFEPATYESVSVVEKSL